ncbi:MAG: hypothetical protein C0603_00975 [Denitrovibrio sp.]|nr:MAG: hypothetical protein C0603_00975 [Denitrovibrio sp.]
MLAKLQVRTEDEATMLTVTPDEAELLYTSDEKQLYIGDGTTVGGILVTDTPFIREDMTLNVPADYSDINEALDFLSAFRISNNATVTIDVANGTYVYTETILVNHPDAAFIRIVGNETTPSSCVLWNPIAEAVVQVKGVSLGYLSGFKIVGEDDQVNHPYSGTVNRMGLEVESNGGSEVGSLEVIYCYNGVNVKQNSFANIDVLKGTNCSVFAVYVSNCSSVRMITSCDIQDNTYGIAAGTNSYLVANTAGMVIKNSTQIGAHANYNSTVDVSGATITGNGARDINVQNNSFIAAHGTTFSTSMPAPNVAGADNTLLITA